MIGLFAMTIFWIPCQCKILRVREHFTANFIIVDSYSRVTSGCFNNLTEPTSTQCALKCIHEEPCKTFNYHKIENICELLEISKFDGVSILRRQTYWVHYETDDDASEVTNLFLVDARGQITPLIDSL